MKHLLLGSFLDRSICSVPHTGAQRDFQHLWLLSRRPCRWAVKFIRARLPGAARLSSCVWTQRRQRTCTAPYVDHRKQWWFGPSQLPPSEEGNHTRKLVDTDWTWQIRSYCFGQKKDLCGIVCTNVCHVYAHTFAWHLLGKKKIKLDPVVGGSPSCNTYTLRCSSFVAVVVSKRMHSYLFDKAVDHFSQPEPYMLPHEATHLHNTNSPVRAFWFFGRFWSRWHLWRSLCHLEMSGQPSWDEDDHSQMIVVAPSRLVDHEAPSLVDRGRKVR